MKGDDGVWNASPMLPLFVSLGLCDIMFAFDSIPAILGAVVQLMQLSQMHRHHPRFLHSRNFQRVRCPWVALFVLVLGSAA